MPTSGDEPYPCGKVPNCLPLGMTLSLWKGAYLWGCALSQLGKVFVEKRLWMMATWVS